MIDELQVENLALIRHAVLQPAAGMTVLTGETGAGKTALISALQLLMGGRATKDAVRDGEDSLTVSGRFFRDVKVGGVPDEWASKDGACSEGMLDGVGDEDELVILRSVRADGKSRATMNGRMASAGELREAVSPLVDLCGQHEHQRLMQPAQHMRMLDSWADESVAEALKTYRKAFDRAAEAQAELERVLESASASSAKLDEARFVCKRMEAVRPQAGEYEELVISLRKAENAESLAMAADGAHQALSGEGGALDGLNAAIAALESASRFDDGLCAYAESLREAGYVLEDVSHDARTYRDSIEFDEESLRANQERMSELQGLLRTYGPRMEDVLEAWAQAVEAVSLVDDAVERERAARSAVDAAEADLAQAAEALANARSDAAPRFVREACEQMARLEMGGAQLECLLEDVPRAQWTRMGSQTVEFMFRPGAGMQARPLARIASGGEMSRVMLACKVVLGSRDNVDTLVFDEVDAGVGGSTANALAEVLADLARTHQVIVITHLAQVAVRGDAHYVVRKTAGEVPETQLLQLSEDARPAEIARMLSGSATEASLTHAKELLEQARSL